VKNVIITGFMGTGKSSVGTILARLLGMRFVDTDRLIEKNEGRSVSEIFSSRGEEYFREREREVCAGLANLTDTVIATGGGTLLIEENLRGLTASGRLFCLHAPPEVIAERVSSTESRPLLNAGRKEESVRDLLSRRMSRYEEMGELIDTAEASEMEAALRIAESLDIPEEKLLVHMGAQQYPALIGRGVSLKLGAFLAARGKKNKVFLAGPEKVLDLFGEQLQCSLARQGVSAQRIVLNDGEQFKSFEEAQRIIDLLIQSGVERSSVIVALGGGVTGDLAGFVASILMRGIGLVHVPTTLLAQVDSCLGGKVAVNRGGIKNIVGAFYKPLAVFVDPCFLLTLESSEIANGMAEIVKAAVIGSEELFSVLENEGTLVVERLELIESITKQALKVKAGIVSEDPFESDRRRVLNFGHTFAHALESVHDLSGLSHGEAVALGMIAATSVAVKRGYAGRSLLGRLRDVLLGVGLPVRAPECSMEQIYGSMALDKKVREGKAHFVLPEGIGRMRIVDDLSRNEIADAFREISDVT
jgi:3-dehydroquinate synthase